MTWYWSLILWMLVAMCFCALLISPLQHNLRWSVRLFPSALFTLCTCCHGDRHPCKVQSSLSVLLHVWPCLIAPETPVCRIQRSGWNLQSLRSDFLSFFLFFFKPLDILTSDFLLPLSSPLRLSVTLTVKCYVFFVVCKLFIAFWLFAFLLKWSVRLKFCFFCTCCSKSFFPPVVDIFRELGKTDWLKEKENVCFSDSFFFLHKI